jgi:hypothetical protein
MNRLDALSPELARQLRHASAALQSAVAVAACEYAIACARVRHPIVDEALGKLREGRVLRSSTKADLNALVETLDEQYFKLQDAAEDGLASNYASQQVFGQVRAVAALVSAFNADHCEASMEAVYEAAAVTDQSESLLSQIGSMLP